MTKLYRVRPAEAKDLPWLLEESKKFDAQFNAKIPLYNEEHLKECFMKLIGNHIVLICDRDGERAGFIAGVVTPHFFNPQILALAEVLWWVTHSFRGTRAALMLIDAFLDYGRGNVDWITLSLESQSQLNERSLLKRGFKLKEKSYLKEFQQWPQ